MHETIFSRQANQVAAVADSKKKESTGKDSKSLSEKDAKVIRKFLQELKPYEADALRIAIDMADGNVTMATLPSDEQLALNRFMNSGMTKEHGDSQQVQTHRIHRVSQLCKRTADYCNKMQMLAAFDALMDFAVNATYVDQARAGLDKMAATRTGQPVSSHSTNDIINK